MIKEINIVTIIGSILSSGVLSVLITHILYSSKLKKDLKLRGNDMIAQNVESSLQFVRNMELIIKTQEIFNVEGEVERRGSGVNVFEGECIYPAIFNDWKSYYEFSDMIQECRKVHEKNLSCRIALNLVFIDRYIYQLGLFLKENGCEDDLPFWGAIFIFDLQAWQTKMDKILVREINKHTYKLESHESKKWKIMRKWILIRQYKKTIL